MCVCHDVIDVAMRTRHLNDDAVAMEWTNAEYHSYVNSVAVLCEARSLVLVFDSISLDKPGRTTGAATHCTFGRIMLYDEWYNRMLRSAVYSDEKLW